MEHAASQDVTGFVLAGGKSSRMGKDKALLEVEHGKTLIESALDMLGAVCASVVVVGPPERYAHFATKFVEDLHPDCGPLGGIHAALNASTTELNVVIGVDMPLLSPSLVRFMVSRARANTKIVTAPRVGGRIQPLCAVYRRQFAAVASSSLVEHRNKIVPLLDVVPVEIIEESEMVAAGFNPNQLANVNTPEEFQHWRQVVLGAVASADN